MDYEKTIVASGPVIIEDGKVLLNRHGKTSEDQKIWKFPGGKIESADVTPSGNTLERCCVREAKEEMGIDVEIIASLKPMIVSHPNDDKVGVVLIHFLAKRIGEVSPGNEIIEWDWFDIKNLPENCAPNIAPVIEDYLKLISTDLADNLG
jgi:ADP-ribose pyrophosphatase YjhB (NUDIX family)